MGAADMTLPNADVTPRIGEAIDQVVTPALALDLDACERNMQRMAQAAADAGVRLRPHAKAHRCPEIALRQVAAGAVGVCCQTVGEAEAMVAAGIADVLVTNEIVDPRKLARLAGLAGKARVALCVDDEAQVVAAAEAARAVGVELGVLVEIEVGMGRCGIAPGEPAAALAAVVAGSAGLRFDGLQAYHGGAQHLATPAERRAAIDGAALAVRQTLAAIEARGLACAIVSGGGTGTYPFEASSGLWNELQCGSYLFMDREYAALDGPGAVFEHSVFVLASVISAPAADRVVLDAGLKSLSAEKGLPLVAGRADLTITGVSDEHSVVRLARAVSPPPLGSVIALIPSHCDPTVNLHDTYICYRGDTVVDIWPIAARGLSR